MGTRSRIGIKLDDGNVKHIYCYWDGYISNNDDILLNHYKSKDKIMKLIDLNDPIVSSEDKFWEDIEEYGYLYDNGKWFVKTSNKKCDMVELTEDVINMEKELDDSCFK